MRAYEKNLRLYEFMAFLIGDIPTVPPGEITAQPGRIWKEMQMESKNDANDKADLKVNNYCHNALLKCC